MRKTASSPAARHPTPRALSGLGQGRLYIEYKFETLGIPTSLGWNYLINRLNWTLCQNKEVLYDLRVSGKSTRLA